MAITIKNASEIDKMHTAGRLAMETLEMIGPYVKAGVTTNELDKICHDYIVNQQHAIPAPLNYRGFPKSICTSLNHTVCHGIPSDKKLKKGDIINIDITVIKDGFHGDTSKMFFIGKPSIRAKRLVTVAYDALFEGIKAAQPGAKLSNIGQTIENYVDSYNFSVVEEYCGHGIGRDFHEEPQVVHFGKRPKKPNEKVQEEVILEPGMTFTIEPMINAGKHAIKLLPDNWTVVTKDRSLSAQWEHTILITKTGNEILTLRPDEQY